MTDDSSWSRMYEITPDLAEDVVFYEDIQPQLGVLPDNVMRIWAYGFTEMFNNAIDHSGGHNIMVSVKAIDDSVEVMVIDDGVGIFKKIQRELGLDDERESLLELAKGKLTTDPKRHSGEGIFFTSRAFDKYVIVSGSTHFSHQAGDDWDWLFERETDDSGTSVFMKLRNDSPRVLKDVFDQFSTDDDFGFTKTVVPVRLAKYGSQNLVSRSQAKRLLARVEKFKTVLFDFSGIDSIGQAFADEIFRVFPSHHPEVEVFPVHANEEVSKMIERVQKSNVNPDEKT